MHTKITGMAGILATALLLAAGPVRSAVVLDPATFDANTEGWTGIGWDVFGQSAFDGGALEGYMEDNASFPQYARFRIDSGSVFLGDYLDEGATGIEFSLYSAQVHPGELAVILGDLDGNAYTYGITPVATVGEWVTYTVPLFLGGWDGGPASFMDLLADVEYLEILVRSRGTDPQTYYLDDVQLIGVEITAIPEPGTLSIMLGMLVVVWLRRRLAARPRRVAGEGGDMNIILLLLATLLLPPAAVRGEFVAAETFDANLSGAGSEAVPSSRTWSWNAGSALASFNATANPPPPGQRTALLLGSSASGGAFAGDYRAEGVALIGFDFLPETRLPASLRIEMRSGAKAVFRHLGTRLAQTGTWHRLVVPLDRAVGGWLPANDTLFEEVLADVDTVRITVGRGGVAQEIYRIDNIFLARPHRAGSIRIVAGDEELPGDDDPPDAGAAAPAMELVWSGLLDGVGYRVEATTNLASGVWTPAGTFMAEEGLLRFVERDAGDRPAQAYRLVLE